MGPNDPAFTQSCQAACISSTKACPSALWFPWDVGISGFATGVNSPLEVICCVLLWDECDVLGAMRALRDASARGICEWLPASTERR